MLQPLSLPELHLSLAPVWYFAESFWIVQLLSVAKMTSKLCKPRGPIDVVASSSLEQMIGSQAETEENGQQET